MSNIYFSPSSVFEQRLEFRSCCLTWDWAYVKVGLTHSATKALLDISSVYFLLLQWRLHKWSSWKFTIADTSNSLQLDFHFFPPSEICTFLWSVPGMDLPSSRYSLTDGLRKPGGRSLCGFRLFLSSCWSGCAWLRLGATGARGFFTRRPSSRPEIVYFRIKIPVLFPTTEKDRKSDFPKTIVKHQMKQETKRSSDFWLTELPDCKY